MRVALQPAFILHHRPLRETSVLLDVFTEEYGCISLVARGVRARRSELKLLLQPFRSLLLSFQGKRELMQLVAAEAQEMPIQLRGDNLLSAFYLNELLMRLLQKQDAYPRLFKIYKQTLQDLNTATLNPVILRLFEKKLLEELGYGLPLEADFATGLPLEAEMYYHYYPEQGFKRAEITESQGFRGEHLLALKTEQFQYEGCLQEIKRLMRLVFATLLGKNELRSRELFIK